MYERDAFEYDILAPYDNIRIVCTSNENPSDRFPIIIMV